MTSTERNWVVMVHEECFKLCFDTSSPNSFKFKKEIVTSSYHQPIIKKKIKIQKLLGDFFVHEGSFTSLVWSRVKAWPIDVWKKKQKNTHTLSGETKF